MPSRDKDGRPLLGATLLKRARERHTANAVAAALERGNLPGCADFDALGSPPLGRPREAAATRNRARRGRRRADRGRDWVFGGCMGDRAAAWECGPGFCRRKLAS